MDFQRYNESSVRLFEFRQLNTEPARNDMTKPKPRSGHRICCHNGFLYSFGGYNPELDENVEFDILDLGSFALLKELWQLNLSSCEWTKLECTGSIPEHVASHAMVRQNNTLIVYGGTGVPFGEASTNDVLVCSLHNKHWKVVATSGTKPEPMYGQGMYLDEDYIYVVGGTSGSMYSLDVHTLNLRTAEWQVLSQNTPTPKPRYRHEIVVYEYRIIVFGGGTSEKAFELKNLPVFMLDNREWKFMKTKKDGMHGYPAPRRCHAIVRRNKFVYVIGGFIQNRILDDVWRFNLQNKKWKKLPIALPSPVYFHAADITPEGCLYVFGGVVKLEPQVRSNSVWECWLEIPSLKEMCWRRLIHKFPNILNVPSEQLLEIGIPLSYVEKLQSARKF